ncbi:hypothetical protein FL966_09305 [Caproiciproducens galactitolivorans]|uniref:Uncharacterized protein n=2 Tax=Caproiciproducens galactitolivorans TaxID=642589 RepID=A0A4Z0YCD0_9FIRM|nr:hypothetical protein [Caproiciproducens galactitolivorans]QEY35220.1 hypothetical protein FL966_09305 [Caproiciproducens galactitolivorans]TGJ76911.1 hypothetical protein CAGA_09840 [Caproiciproducens galactitolivorans]
MMKEKGLYRGIVLSALAFFAVLCLFWFGFGNAQRANSREKLQVTQAAIQKGIVSCYAVEGFYPPNIKYLEEHYGITIDHSKYIVHYETAGENVMPSVEVLEKDGNS